MNFDRNDFLFWTTIAPVLFVFFIFGAIYFLEPREQISTRVTVTLAIFAFVFAFETILSNLKAHYNISTFSTFADLLPQLALMGAILFTISSLVGYRLVTMKSSNNWINRILRYNIYDMPAVIFLVVAIIGECVANNIFSLEYRDLIYPIIIIISWGWGLPFQIISQYRLKQRERRSRHFRCQART
jgi:hypothetical protein